MLSPAHHGAVYRRMLVLRSFEEAVAQACADGTVHGEMHLAVGQEAVAAVLERHLRRGDAVVSTHRPHLHALAAGVDPVLLLAELFERDGLNHGKGGHMHLFDTACRFMCTGIVGASAPLALGYALAQTRCNESSITVAAVGDAAMNQGAVLESMNLAAVLELPVLFLVEDNDLGISVRKNVSTAGILSERGTAFGIVGMKCDGRDVEQVNAAMEEAMAVVRGRGRPALLVAEVDRFRGHYEGDAVQYRTQEDIAQMHLPERDPLGRLRSSLHAGGVSDVDLDTWAHDARAVVTDWCAKARAVPPPRPESALTGLWAHG